MKFIIAIALISSITGCAYGRPDYENSGTAPPLVTPEGLSPLSGNNQAAPTPTFAAGSFKPDDTLPPPPTLEQSKQAIDLRITSRQGQGKNKPRLVLAVPSEGSLYDRLILTQGLDQAWLDLRLALERAGFIVEQRNRDDNWVRIQYFDSALERGSLNERPLFYLLLRKVKEENEVSVYDGKIPSTLLTSTPPLGNAYSAQILKVLSENF